MADYVLSTGSCKQSCSCFILDAAAGTLNPVHSLDKHRQCAFQSKKGQKEDAAHSMSVTSQLKYNVKTQEATRQSISPIHLPQDTGMCMYGIGPGVSL